MSRALSRRGVALGAALGLTAALLAGPGAASGPADELDPDVRKDFRTCAKPALTPAIRTAKPKTEEARLAHQVAGVGRVQKVPARAQALAVAAALEGDLPKNPVAFYKRLRKVRGWQTLPPSIAVHRVLGTADPFAYENEWERAVQVLGRLMTARADIERLLSPGGQAPKECYASGVDLRGLPLPAGSGYAVRPADHSPRGQKAGPQKPGETAFKASCGTDVLAAISGRVEIVRNSPTAGPWTIKVTGNGMTARYTHVQNVQVKSGDAVTPDRKIAEVGDLGSVRNCTLGVSLTRKTKRGSEILDPVQWLVPAGANAAVTSIAETSFVVGSYNVLGERLRRGGVSRTARGMSRVAAHGIDILILNELEHGQAGVVQGRGWALHRATFDNANGHGSALAWRPEEWKAIETGEVATPINRRQLHHPTALLEHVETGARVWVLGVHNPVGHNGPKARARRVSESIQKGWVEQVRDEAPVIVGGDFNDRGPALGSMTGSGMLHTAAGGGQHPVDWIFATTDLDLTGETVERFERSGISDHPLIVTGMVFPEHERADYGSYAENAEESE